MHVGGSMFGGYVCTYMHVEVRGQLQVSCSGTPGISFETRLSLALSSPVRLDWLAILQKSSCLCFPDAGFMRATTSGIFTFSLGIELWSSHLWNKRFHDSAISSTEVQKFSCSSMNWICLYELFPCIGHLQWNQFWELLRVWNRFTNVFKEVWPLSWRDKRSSNHDYGTHYMWVVTIRHVPGLVWILWHKIIQI